MYAIIDIETTGGNGQHEKIIEIAVFVHDGFQIVEQFSTLINPEKNIPYFITRLTGITNEMVANAPKFYDIAKKIIQLTEGTIFVAHNVSFDYNFVYHEFKNLGFDFIRKKLCTVQLSRKLIPGKKSYSLGKLCDELGISIPAHQRHRAAGDALATVKLFEMLLKANTNNTMSEVLNKQDAFKKLKTDLHKNLLVTIPEQTGVYYLNDIDGKTIYIGKSINIKDRILQHLTNHSSKKSIEMINTLHNVDYVITGSDLVACLLEADEIKKVKPIFNRAQRKSVFNYGILTFYDLNGYINFKIEKLNKEADPLITFSTLNEAKSFMFDLVEKYQLCQKLSGIYHFDGPCFQYQIKKCKGACIGSEEVEEYNKKAESIILLYQYEFENFLIIDKGRDKNERSVVRVENGKYMGFGYFDPSLIGNDLDELKNSIKKYNETKDITQIIRSVLFHKKYEKLIKY